MNGVLGCADCARFRFMRVSVELYTLSSTAPPSLSGTGGSFARTLKAKKERKGFNLFALA